jgi:Uma2 family endonuclease
MATLPKVSVDQKIEYPCSDGKPVAETPTHRDILLQTIDLLRRHLADDPASYVSGNMLMYYVPGNKRKHVSPDIFVVRGIIDRDRRRDDYLTWEEGRGPDMVIEVTSSSTRKEDLKIKYDLYRDTFRVGEYFLFDPFSDYLDPPLQGFRLIEGQYVPIEPVAGRLPSAVARVHLERVDSDLKLFDPETGEWLRDGWILRDPRVLLQQEQETRRRAEAEKERLALQLQESEAERERLRRELEALRRRFPDGADGS